jgi:hypothetical protein
MKNVETDKEKELLDILARVIGQACEDGSGEIDSMALTAYAMGIDLLEEYGLLEVSASEGRRRIGRWNPNQAN